MTVDFPRSDDLPTPSTTGPVIDLPFDYVDFEGPCADCGTDCVDEWERMFDRKFTSGFIVDQDSTDIDPKGGFPERLLFSGGSWPQYSTKAQTYSASGEYTTIPISSEVKVGDIRVAYTDHWIVMDPNEMATVGTERTFMKRPEEYWAAKANPYGSQGSMSDDEWKIHRDKIDEDRLEWIRCRHTHTDHQHNQTLGGGSTIANPSTHEYPIVVDDCITGIWDYNLVDTCTTIEKFGIYEAVNFYEVFPACGSTSRAIPSLANASDPLIHVLNKQPLGSEHDHAGCGSQKHNELYEAGDWFYFMGDEPGHAQPCDCDSKRSQYGKTVMAITSPSCDHTLARYSKSPHRVGIGYNDVSGVTPNAPNVPLYDNEGEDKTFGAISETFLFKVGEFYKTTVRHFGTTLEPFQAPSGAAEEMWTFRHPEESGNGDEINSGSKIGGGCWCTNPFKPDSDPQKIWQTKYCAKMLLQLPCMRPLDCSNHVPAEHVEDFETDGDGVQCCENWDPAYCEEQLENIYFSEVELLKAFDRDNRHKGADFTKNSSRPRIHSEGDPIRCQTSQIYGWVWLLEPCEGFGQDKWERMTGIPSRFQKNCSPSGSNCRCSQFPGSPPESLMTANVGSEVEVASAWETGHAVVVSLLWGIDGVDFGTSCSWSQDTTLGFRHCNQEDGFLVGVAFFEGNFKEPTSGKIDWTEITKSKLHPPKTIPKKDPLVNGVVVKTPWSEGGMHDDMVTSIAAWTNFNSTLPEQSNTSFSQKDQRFQTDYEAAEVFYKAAGTQYWYKGVSKKGKQLTGKYGELEDNVAAPDYLATDEMETSARGAQSA